jgi:predicted enzyme related to lactoylglutathione lyase
MGNPFCHVELSTDDVLKAKKFYKGLFDWKFEAFGPDYTMIKLGKGTAGGMMPKQMPGQPTMWLPYVEVKDVRKTIAKAKKLGADVKVDYMEIAGGMGSFGVFVDPTGAGIGVYAQAKKAPKKAKKAKKRKG